MCDTKSVLEQKKTDKQHEVAVLEMEMTEFKENNKYLDTTLEEYNDTCRQNYVLLREFNANKEKLKHSVRAFQTEIDAKKQTLEKNALYKNTTPNFDIDYINTRAKQMEECNSKLAEQYKQAELLEKFSTVQDLIKYQYDTISQLLEKQEALYGIKKEIKELDQLLLEELWRQKYMDYAVNNAIAFDPKEIEQTLDIEFVKKCNTHHFNMLLKGKKTECECKYRKHYYSYGRASCDCGTRITVTNSHTNELGFIEYTDADKVTIIMQFTPVSYRNMSIYL